MALGPGKYDDACTEARVKTKAMGAALIVFGGEGGDGFSCQAPAPLLIELPTILRRMADEIEASLPKH